MLKIEEIGKITEQKKTCRIRRGDIVHELVVVPLSAKMQEDLTDMFPEKELLGRKGESAKSIMAHNDEQRRNRVYGGVCMALREAIDWETMPIRRQIEALMDTFNSVEVMHLWSIACEDLVVPAKQVEERVDELAPLSSTSDGTSNSTI